MKKYLAFDGINFEYEEFETLKEAQKWQHKFVDVPKTKQNEKLT